jgi:DNA invertase Pin-like site-specific DNA recombinase
MVTAYLRVSTGKQHLENQKSEINRYASQKGITVNKWVTETISGKTDQNKRKLGKLIKTLQTGDTLIVTEISRLSRTLHEVMSIMGVCLSKKITIYSTKDGYAFDDSINSKVLSFAFGLVAEIERNLISQRTKEALSVRRAKGVTLGRKKGQCPKMERLNTRKKDIIKMIDQGKSIACICKKYNLSIETFRSFRKNNEDIDELIIDRYGEKRYLRLVENAKSITSRPKT